MLFQYWEAIKFVGTTYNLLGSGTNKVPGFTHFTTPNTKLNARDTHGLSLTKATKK